LKVSPLVVRLVSVPDDLTFDDLHEVLRLAVLPVLQLSNSPSPRRRLWELLKSQGIAENQQVVFLSDGGDTVRSLQEYIHPNSEHWIDWFHITMRITVLSQQIKVLKSNNRTWERMRLRR
jgi:hypothetical protein